MTRKHQLILLTIFTAVALSTAGGYLGHLITITLEMQHWAQNAALDNPLL